jgi:hypothetical protein
MLSSYRERLGCSAALALLSIGGTASAQQIYFQPQAEVGIQEDSNRNLVPSGDTVDKKSWATGVSGDANGLLGIATPRTDTTIRPDVSFDEYPSLHTHDLNTLLDLNSGFHDQRDQASLQGQFNRQSTYSSELANPLFNVVNPNLPTTPETGRISTSTNRTLVTVVPAFDYDLTQRISWGVTGTFQSVDYSGSEAAAYVPYNYYQGSTSVGYAVTPLFTAKVGAFVGRDQAKDDTSSVNTDGGTLELDYKWSKLITASLVISGERDETKEVGTQTVSETGTGATFNTNWQGEISKVQLSAGRSFTPSGSGGMFRADQVQVEYNRDLSQRMDFTAAARVINARSVGTTFASSDYNYVNIVTRLQWKITRTWYIAGGAEYVRTHNEPPIGTAKNGFVYVSVGYKGLGKPQ